MTMKAGLLLTLALVTALVFLPLKRASATDPALDEFQISVLGTSLDTPVFVRGIPTLGDALRSLTVFAGGAECLTVDLTDRGARNAEGNLVISLGAPGQPPECSTSGEHVVFVDGNGLELFQEFRLSRGVGVTVQNLGPKPPHSVPRIPTMPDPARGAAFEILVPASILDGPLAESLSPLKVFVNTTNCGAFDLTQRSPGVDVVIALGTAEQPAGCATEGGRIVLVRPPNIELFREFTLRIGRRVTLDNAGPKPLSLRPSPIRPPAAGDGGLLVSP